MRTIIFAVLAGVLAASFLFSKYAPASEITRAPDPARVLQYAEAGDPRALDLFQKLRQLGGEAAVDAFTSLAGSERQALAVQLTALTDRMDIAGRYARTVLGNPGFDEEFFDHMALEVLELDQPEPKLSELAAEAILNYADLANDIVGLRADILDRYSNELRRGKANPGTKLAWALVRAGSGGPDIEIYPYSFRRSSSSAQMDLALSGTKVRVTMSAEDVNKRVRAEANGFAFTTGWAMLLQKPLTWVAMTAESLEQSGVDREQYPEWEILEGPGGLIALAPGSDGVPAAFFEGHLLRMNDYAPPPNFGTLVNDVETSAQSLHQAVMDDDSIPRRLRNALDPILAGTYLPIDSHEFFDAAFCRRLIEANYLETFVNPLPPAVSDALAVYRSALGKLEAGYDAWSIDIDDQGRDRLVAVVDPDREQHPNDDRYPGVGDTLPKFQWRREKGDTTTFYRALPNRSFFALTVAETFAGQHSARPAGLPDLTEVWHPVKGLLSSYRTGAASAEGDSDTWVEALAVDRRGGSDPTTGPLGWSFPLHVPVYNDQGDPAILAVTDGMVESPDFSRIADPETKRSAQDGWLHKAAATLNDPGRLNLFYVYFCHYTSDSPLPENPNLIGSRKGLSDNHQTVYQSLDRRWVGRFIGDCDDLAAFFQDLTRRQGKLSHVMSLPSHAAAGYVDKLADDKYRFIVLQTGPTLQFTGSTLEEAVELAYRHFEDDDSVSRFTTSAVPVQLRFSGDDTQGDYLLPARIYADADYAETMIRVQEYWHFHAFSTAIREMEEIVKTDKDPGNTRELSSLYERVGLYEDSVQLRLDELERAAEDEPAVALSTLVDIAQMFKKDKNDAGAHTSLDGIEDAMKELWRQRENGDDEGFYSLTLPYRTDWAVLMTRLGRGAEAWERLRLDVEIAKEDTGRVTETLLYALVDMYNQLVIRQGAEPRSSGLESLGSSFEETPLMREIAAEIDGAWAGYFKPDDAYNDSIRRYGLLGRFAVAREGRYAGIEKLKQDGPYPTGERNHVSRTAGVMAEDWEWFRIAPFLYLSLGREMLDQEDYPEAYDPEAARAMLERVSRAVEQGSALGAAVDGEEHKLVADLILSFVNRDLDLYNQAMRVVSSRNYAKLYNKAASAFGLFCDLIPAEEFPAWIDAFHSYFAAPQHYFMVVYQMIGDRNYDHALALARAAAGFFPDNDLMLEEARYVEELIPRLLQRQAEKEAPRREIESVSY